MTLPSAKSCSSSVVTDIIMYSLAKAMMHLALVAIFRHFDTELFKTSRKDVDPKKGSFVSVPESPNGVRVLGD